MTSAGHGKVAGSNPPFSCVLFFLLSMLLFSRTHNGRVEDMQSVVGYDVRRSWQGRGFESTIFMWCFCFSLNEREIFLGCCYVRVEHMQSAVGYARMTRRRFKPINKTQARTFSFLFSYLPISFWGVHRQNPKVNGWSRIGNFGHDY